MLDYIIEQSSLILTGIILSLISGFIYTMTSTGFISGGKFRTKPQAIIIFLGVAFILGTVTPIIDEFSEGIINVIPLLSIFGVLIISANLIVNMNIKRWRHTTPITLLIYAVGIILSIIGYYPG
jgi:hypothetical protein